jgi:hypothetical protein
MFFKLDPWRPWVPFELFISQESTSGKYSPGGYGVSGVQAKNMSKIKEMVHT